MEQEKVALGQDDEAVQGLRKFEARCARGWRQQTRRLSSFVRRVCPANCTRCNWAVDAIGKGID